MLIQIRLKPNVIEGDCGGYYNYEFGIKVSSAFDDMLCIANFNGPTRDDLEEDRNGFSIKTNEFRNIMRLKWFSLYLTFYYLH